MGNRAHVIFVAGKRISPAIYLHWNGGPESVYPFLDELDRRHVRADGEYDAARFVHIIGDFFDQDRAGGHSLGVCNGPAEITPEALKPYDHGDNGVYVVSRAKDARNIRRFQSVRVGEEADGRGKYVLREADAEAVKQEREAAYKDKYNQAGDDGDTIAETFARLRPTVED